MENILTSADANSLASIIQDAQRNNRVARLIDGHVYRGEVRRFCTESGEFFPRDQDIRDAFIEVQLPIGQAFWPIRELIAERNRYEYMTDINR